MSKDEVPLIFLFPKVNKKTREDKSYSFTLLTMNFFAI